MTVADQAHRIKTLASTLHRVCFDLSCCPALVAVEEAGDDLGNALVLAGMLKEITKDLPGIVDELELAAERVQP